LQLPHGRTSAEWFRLLPIQGWQAIDESDDAAQLPAAKQFAHRAEAAPVAPPHAERRFVHDRGHKPSPRGWTRIARCNWSYNRSHKARRQPEGHGERCTLERPSLGPVEAIIIPWTSPTAKMSAGVLIRTTAGYFSQARGGAFGVSATESPRRQAVRARRRWRGAASEADLRSELDLARVQLVQHGTEIRLIDDTAHQVKIGMVRQVEELVTHLYVHALPDAEIAGDGRVQVDQARADDGIAPERPKPVSGGQGERRRIEQRLVLFWSAAST